MKLVRDNIPAIILEKQDNCAYAECKDHELLKRLLEKKLFEEANEFIEAEVLPEAADVVTVLYYLYLEGIKDYDGELVTFDQFLNDLKIVAKKKLETNGGFEKGYILLDRSDYSND